MAESPGYPWIPQLAQVLFLDWIRDGRQARRRDCETFGCGRCGTRNHGNHRDYPGVSSRYGYMGCVKKLGISQKAQNNGYIMLYMAILLEKMRINGQIWGTPCSDKPCSPFPKSWDSASDKSIFNGLKWSILRLKYQQMSESKERVTLVS